MGGKTAKTKVSGVFKKNTAVAVAKHQCVVSAVVVFHSHALTRTCFPTIYWVLP